MNTAKNRDGIEIANEKNTIDILWGAGDIEQMLPIVGLPECEEFSIVLGVAKPAKVYCKVKNGVRSFLLHLNPKTQKLFIREHTEQESVYHYAVPKLEMP